MNISTIKAMILATLLTVVVGLHGCNVLPPATVDYTPIIACELGLAAVAAEVVGPLPGPDPTPLPGGTCPNCRGTGKVGDGTIFVKCVPCDGTGKVLAVVPAMPAVRRGKCGCNLDRKILRADGRWVHEDCPCGLNCVCDADDRPPATPSKPAAVESPRTQYEQMERSSPRRRLFRGFRGG